MRPAEGTGVSESGVCPGRWIKPGFHVQRREEQGSELWGFPDNASGGVDTIQLRREGESCKTAVQSVLKAPCLAFVIESEPVSAPSMTNEVVDGAKPVECTAKPTVEQRMHNAVTGSHSRRDL